MTVNSQQYTMQDLLTVMQQLRDPDSGCPWDLAQTPQTLKRYTIEECYELLDAIDTGDAAHIAEELGDVLLQVVFYCQFAQEQGDFSFVDVVSQLTQKLIRRHPHVFQSKTESIMNIDDVSHVWERAKQQERNNKARHGLFDDLPKALPALMRAQKLQKRAARIGLDFENAKAAIDILKQEIIELEEALATDDMQTINEELGDVIFSSVNVARLLSVDAETSLTDTSQRFVSRVLFVEQAITTLGVSWQSLSTEQQDILWTQAKQQVDN